jgi:putative tricarboxylic transport membrane protein
MSSEAGSDGLSLSSRPLARLAVAVAALIAGGSAALSVFMPALIATGGIRTAQDFTTLSPVFFPRLAFAMLAVLGVVYLVGARAAAARNTRPLTATESDRLVRAALMALLVAAYAFVIPILGFIVATMASTAAVGLFLGARRALGLLAWIVVLPLAIRFIFERLLLIALPRSTIDAVARVEDAVMNFLVAVILGQ